jgi:multidrug transporter EmrE-like cation transporter
MKHVIALLAALLLNATANLLMKAGMKQIGDTGGVLKEGVVNAIRTVLAHPSLIIGLACFALNAAFYMYALQSRKLPISVAYPVMVGGGYVLIATIAYLNPALAERLDAGQWVGVGLVMIGVLIIAMRTPAVP